MVIAILEMTMPEGHELDTVRALRAFWDSTCALPGCRGGGVYQEAGSFGTALYVEIWGNAAQLETHVRSRGYDRLLAITETRGLEWVEHLRLGTASTTGGGE